MTPVLARGSPSSLFLVLINMKLCGAGIIAGRLPGISNPLLWTPTLSFHWGVEFASGLCGSMRPPQRQMCRNGLIIDTAQWQWSPMLRVFVPDLAL
jgi:hypothetical protein